MEKLETLAVENVSKVFAQDVEAITDKPGDIPAYTGVSLVNREIYNGGTSIMYWM